MRLTRTQTESLEARTRRLARVRAYRVRHYEQRTKENWLAGALKFKANEAKRRGLEFDLVPDDLTIPDVCPILLLPFDFKSRHNPCNPSLDRHDPKLGYVKGNVSVISRMANTMKSNCVDPDVPLRLADYMRVVLTR